MSTDQDKDSFSLKRTRGGDAALDGLGAPGLLHGSPDKKRRKTNTQPPLLAPLSEFAPPANTSSDHLVASNPFDDNYNCPPASLKPRISPNPYLCAPHHPGLGVYTPSRMATLVQNRTSTPYGPPYLIRNQPPFVHNPMGPLGFNRTSGFNYGHLENPAFTNQPGFNNNNHMFLSHGPTFRENPNHGRDFSPDGIVGMTRLLVGKPSPNQASPGGIAQTVTPKQERCESTSKTSTPPRKPSQGAEQGTAQDADLKTKSKTATEGKKINGAIHSNSEVLKKSPQPAENVKRPSKPGPALSSKIRRGGAAPPEPMYPCGICQGEVNDDQEAILCEASCQKWFHRVCTGMTETAYNLLTAESAAVWGCDACMNDKETGATSGPATVNSEGHT